MHATLRTDYARLTRQVRTMLERARYEGVLTEDSTPTSNVVASGRRALRQYASQWLVQADGAFATRGVIDVLLSAITSDANLAAAFDVLSLPPRTLPPPRKAGVVAGLLGELDAPPDARVGYGAAVEPTTRTSLARALFGLVCVLGRSTATAAPAPARGPSRSPARSVRADPVLRDLVEAQSARVPALERRCIVLYRRGARRGLVVGALSPLSPEQGAVVLELLRRLACAQEPVAVWILDGLCGSGWTGDAEPALLRDLELSRVFSPAELHRFRTCVRVRRHAHGERSEYRQDTRHEHRPGRSEYLPRRSPSRTRGEYYPGEYEDRSFDRPYERRRESDCDEPRWDEDRRPRAWDEDRRPRAWDEDRRPRAFDEDRDSDAYWGPRAHVVEPQYDRYDEPRYDRYDEPRDRYDGHDREDSESEPTFARAVARFRALAAPTLPPPAEKRDVGVGARPDSAPTPA